MAQSSNKSMSHGKHRKHPFHHQAVHESVKMDMERQDNKQPIKRLPARIYDSIADLMKCRK